LEKFLLQEIKKKAFYANEIIDLVKQRATKKGIPTIPDKKIIFALTNLQHHQLIFYDENADVFWSPKEKKEKKEFRIVQIKCPNCPSEPQNYRYNPIKNRHHTNCKACGKNIEVNSKTIWNASKELKEEKKVSKQILFLDSLDQKILEIIKNHQISHAQKNIAKLCQKHPSTISRHIKKLINAGIIISISKITGIYKIASNVEDIQDEKGKIEGDSIHNFKVKTWILSGTLNANFYKENQMKNWVKKFFDEQNLDFQVNYGKRTSLVFYPTGAGKDPEEAILNAKKKTKDILENLEHKYELELSLPEFDISEVHHVPITSDPETFEALQTVWTDKSHPGAIESSSKEFVKDILKLSEITKKNNELIKQQSEILRLQQEQINNQQMDTQNLKNTILNEIDNKLSKFEKSMATAIGAAIGDALQKYLPTY
jgi:DNA-binding Lrp family transcriptional regulator